MNKNDYKSFSITLLFWFWTCLSVNAQTRHLMCLDVSIDGTFSEMEQKFYDSKVDFGTVAEDRTLYGQYYDRNVYVKLLGGDDRIWGVQLEIDTVLNTREEARLLKNEYERRFKQRYWSVFTEGTLSYYDEVVEKWGISDSHYCTIKTSNGELLGQIYVFIMRYYGDESKYQVYITYVDEINRKASSDSVTVKKSHPAVEGDKGSVLSIREALDIVSFIRHNPLADESAEDKFIVSLLEKYHYVAKDFLEGVGTCSFWQYIKHGNAKFDMTDDDAFVPDNPSLASNVAVIDCSGIETIEHDETSISVDIRVYGVKQREMLLQEMKYIGFVHTKTDEYGKEYSWKSYRIRTGTSSSRGYRYWWFDISLELIDYASTKKCSFADSTGHHDIKFTVDFLVNGSQELRQSVNGFMMDVFKNSTETSEECGWNSIQDVINFYGKKGVEHLEGMDGINEAFFAESLDIKKIAETGQYITFEVMWTGYYGGVLNARKYGATFRKSDGKRMRIIESPGSQQFKSYLNNQLLEYFDKGMLFDEYKDALPFPQYEPYLIQTGVRFVYQKYEISYGLAGVLQEDVGFLEIKNHLTSEVKELLRNNNIE